IVLIGATAIELRDIWESPFGLMPGVEIQANTLQTLLSGQAIHRNPPWMTLIFVFLAAFVLDLSIKGSFQKQSAKILSHFRVFSLATLAMAFFYGLITLYLFKYERILLDVVPVLCAILVHYLSTSVAFNLFTGRSVQVKTMNLSTLYSVGNLSLKKQPLDSALNFLFAMLKEQLKINFMILELYHPKTREFIRRMVRGDETERQIGKNGHLLTPDCQKWIEKSMTLKSSHIVPNLKAALQQENPSDLAIRSSLFIPLITQNGQHGVLHFHSLHPQMFQEEDVKLLYTVTNQLSMNIENLDLIKEVNRLLYSSIEAFSSALELRDNETEGHSQRVAAYATEVGNVMALNQMELEKLRQGALLHDIGKIGVPDAILRKPGKLNEAEMEEIKKHPEFGYQLLKSVDFSEEVARILLHHHEKYDGTGYPQGLSRDDIVIYSRIFSVVDAYDAISSNRPYRKGKPYEVALDEIVHFAGTHFDPKVVEAFIKISKEQLMEIRFKVEETIRKRQVSNIIA
ncbi:MAG: HD domain-containing phosphohydrolase, partial [Calditrichia bacterium]